MPKLTKVNIQELVSASKKYVNDQLKKADVDKNKVLTRTEAKKLAADLKDNFDASGFKLPNGSVKAADVAKEFVVMMEAWAKASDTNGDGYLSTTEAKALPKTLRDNYVNWVGAQETTLTTGKYQSRDLTPKARIAEHEAKFGKQAIGYEKALELALKAVATDTDSGLPSFVSEFGGPDGNGLTDKKKIDAEVRAAEGGLHRADQDDRRDSHGREAERRVDLQRLDRGSGRPRAVGHHRPQVGRRVGHQLQLIRAGAGLTRSRRVWSRPPHPAERW